MKLINDEMQIRTVYERIQKGSEDSFLSLPSITDHHLTLEETIDDAGEKWDECLEVNKRKQLVFLTYLITMMMTIIVLGGVEHDTRVNVGW